MTASETPENERKVDRDDALARKVITAGGYITIFSVVLIVLFIFLEAFPLLHDPEILKKGEWSMPKNSTSLKGYSMGLDEYRETAYRLLENGSVEFLDLKTGNVLESIPHPTASSQKITSSSKMLKRNFITFGTDTGQVGYLQVRFKPIYTREGRKIEQEVEHGTFWELDGLGGAITKVAGTMDEDEEFITIVGLNQKNELAVLIFHREEESTILRLDPLEREITALELKSSGETLVAGTKSGELFIYSIEDGETRLEEKFQASDFPITSLCFLIGDESLIVGDGNGTVSQWLPIKYSFLKNNGNTTMTLGEDGPLAPSEERKLVDKGFHEIKMSNPNLKIRSAGTSFLKVRSFASHDGSVDFIASSPRNKGFLTASQQGEVAYHYATTGKTYASIKLKSALSGLTFAPKSNGFLALGQDGTLFNYFIEEWHPDVTPGILFKSVWYEGYPEPDLVWQSTGGTDDFEPKFSLWPLIFGTLKGTVYALFFAIPISILGAIYLSRLAPPGLRDVIKPIIEIMAAIPSVVVGFLAGLWLSPLISSNLASFFLIMLSIPATWFFVVCIWWAIPWEVRPKLKGKYELFYLLPFALLGMVAASQIAPSVEQTFFYGDIKQWLYQDFGLLYDPRNCVVVGFAMGFAIIPIIFSISEDALTAVPETMTSAAFALAASKWQTALFVVLPAASPGIFAAIMLGLGRAVGETMILLMATGNTPIMDASIFNGLRAMSAAIAVEIPEAPVGGSLYRLLFLTGFLLFIFTFVINTVAALVSNRLRKKYSRF